jgi:hypothetical protein
LQEPHSMSEHKPLPPMSPGIAYAVRRLLEYPIESGSEASWLCRRLWPKMDIGAVETVVVHWKAQHQLRAPAKVAKIA